jgi:hypothetical protein
MKLISHMNDDQDLTQPWLDYYMQRGITAFHIVVHGSREENAKLFELKNSYPIIIAAQYDGEFTSEKKQGHINSVLSTLRGQWVMLADSDEFVELPYRSIWATVMILRLFEATALYAPMLQRLTRDGSIHNPVISDPFREFPLCSADLYRKMGVRATTSKYPLFHCSDSTFIDPGAHGRPNGPSTGLSPLRGVTHHFKWKQSVLKRLSSRINSSHTWRHESEAFDAYLKENGYRLPTSDSFPYSRQELARQGLLKRATLPALCRATVRKFATFLPSELQRIIRNSYQALKNNDVTVAVSSKNSVDSKELAAKSIVSSKTAPASAPQGRR